MKYKYKHTPSIRDQNRENWRRYLRYENLKIKNPELSELELNELFRLNEEKYKKRQEKKAMKLNANGHITEKK